MVARMLSKVIRYDPLERAGEPSACSCRWANGGRGARRADRRGVKCAPCGSAVPAWVTRVVPAEAAAAATGSPACGVRQPCVFHLRFDLTGWR